MQTKKQFNLTSGLFIVYIVILTWIILFKLTFDFTTLDHLRNINLIPFSGSAIVNGRIYMKEIICNIFVFVPVGIYISMLKPEWSFIKKIIPCFLISMSFEVLQFIFAIGASDITDLIGNTLGGVIGIGMFYILQKILKSKTIKIVNILALICTIILVVLLVLLLIISI